MTSTVWQDAEPRLDEPTTTGLTSPVYNHTSRLEFGATYSWQIVAQIGGQGVGPVWDFITQTEPALSPEIAPYVQNAVHNDGNNNGQADPGEVVTLVLSRAVSVATGSLSVSSFHLPVQGDSLGGEGFSVSADSNNARQILLELGEGPILRLRGTYSTTALDLGSSSGIDFAPDLPKWAVVSLPGVPALPREGVDVLLTCAPETKRIDAQGGSVRVGASPDAAYRRHEVTIPPNALSTAVNLEMRPLEEHLGALNAVKVQAADGGGLLSFDRPVSLTLEYRESDIDWASSKEFVGEFRLR